MDEEGEGAVCPFPLLTLPCVDITRPQWRILGRKRGRQFPKPSWRELGPPSFFLDRVGNWPEDALWFLGSFGSGKPEEVRVPLLAPIWCYRKQFCVIRLSGSVSPLNHLTEVGISEISSFGGATCCSKYCLVGTKP